MENGNVEHQNGQLEKLNGESRNDNSEQLDIESNNGKKNPDYHLGSPCEIICPSCHQIGDTILRFESSTFKQRFYAMIKRTFTCWKFESFKSTDRNHYCRYCGCFIGRVIHPGFCQWKYLAHQQMVANS